MSAEQVIRDQALAKAFVTLADTLVADYDVIELLHHLTVECVELLGVDAAGLLLSDQRGTLQMAAASTERARVVELFQLQSDEGPCLDCFRASRPIAAPDLREMTDWPRFIAHTLETGYRSVYALPMRLRNETIGALNLFRVEPGAIAAEELRIAQALADVATIGILQERAIRRREVLAEQLQVALNSRVIIEQAKGVLAQRGDLSMDAAFDRLRTHARDNNLRLSEVARQVVESDVADVVLAGRTVRKQARRR
jgi:transcriptional regulator with GAF, ATPase, and Fis domain